MLIPSAWSGPMALGDSQHLIPCQHPASSDGLLFNSLEILFALPICAIPFWSVKINLRNYLVWTTNLMRCLSSTSCSSHAFWGSLRQALWPCLANEGAKCKTLLLCRRTVQRAPTTLQPLHKLKARTTTYIMDYCTHADRILSKVFTVQTHILWLWLQHCLADIFSLQFGIGVYSPRSIKGLPEFPKKWPC